jgi:hypothetical protein
LDRSELQEILEHAKAALSQAEYDKLNAAMETLIFLTQELEKNRVSIQRLKQLLFGATTEKTQKVMEKILRQTEKDESAGDDAAKAPEVKQKAKGHGRNGAGAYTGADKVHVPHESLKPGDSCPNCQKGTVYESVEPGHLVRIRGQAPLGATVYELQKLRCNLCGQIYTDRLDRLQRGLGIPLPAATQWEIVRDSAGVIEPVLAEMIRQAAQGRVLHNDDTAAKILELIGQSGKSVGSDPTMTSKSRCSSQGAAMPARTSWPYSSSVPQSLTGPFRCATR